MKHCSLQISLLSLMLNNCESGRRMIERKIVIVEDDALLRGLLLNQITSWGFTAKVAKDSIQAVSVCKEFDPDAVVLDVDLGPGLNGFQLAEALGRQMPHLAIVFLTRFPDARASISRMSPALRSASYVNKSAIDTTEDLLNALNLALNDTRTDVRIFHSDLRPLAQLTSKQLEVLKLMYEGKTNQQIALERGKTLSSVENMQSRIFKALQIDNQGTNLRANAIRIYAENYGYNAR